MPITSPGGGMAGNDDVNGGSNKRNFEESEAAATPPPEAADEIEELTLDLRDPAEYFKEMTDMFEEYNSNELFPPSKKFNEISEAEKAPVPISKNNAEKPVVPKDDEEKANTSKRCLLFQN